MSAQTQDTVTGKVDPDVLTYTVGDDPVLDLDLVKWDCLGTAAHVTMLSEMPVTPPVVTKDEAARVRAELAKIVGDSTFTIKPSDQDVHMAVELRLTEILGDLGKKIHTGRSRNDQVAVEVRLHIKDQLLGLEGEVADLAAALVDFGRAHDRVPLVGRTHLQPAMPSSVGVWATGHAEMILDQTANLEAAYALNDLCPLGSAAGYGVPLPLDRQRTSDLLGFARPLHNVFGASMARGEDEAALLSALAQLMAVLSRLAEALILFSMPEFAYFRLPREYCTGSSIMPQKYNPDVLELRRCAFWRRWCAALRSTRRPCARDSLRASSRRMRRFARWRRACRGAKPTMMCATIWSASLRKTPMPPWPPRPTPARRPASTTPSTIAA